VQNQRITVNERNFRNPGVGSPGYGTVPEASLAGRGQLVPLCVPQESPSEFRKLACRLRRSEGGRRSNCPPACPRIGTKSLEIGSLLSEGHWRPDCNSEADLATGVGGQLVFASAYFEDQENKRGDENMSQKQLKKAAIVAFLLAAAVMVLSLMSAASAVWGS